MVVMTTHHLTCISKRRFYAHLCVALKIGGEYIEADYMVLPDQEHKFLQEFLARGKPNGEYLLDLPLSVATQQRLLKEVGFDQVTVIWQRDETAVLVAQ